MRGFRRMRCARRRRAASPASEAFGSKALCRAAAGRPLRAGCRLCRCDEGCGRAPIKASPFTTHAQFSDADTILKLAAPPGEAVIVITMYHTLAPSHSHRARTRPARSRRSVRAAGGPRRSRSSEETHAGQPPSSGGRSLGCPPALLHAMASPEAFRIERQLPLVPDGEKVHGQTWLPRSAAFDDAVQQHVVARQVLPYLGASKLLEQQRHAVAHLDGMGRSLKELSYDSWVALQVDDDCLAELIQQPRIGLGRFALRPEVGNTVEVGFEVSRFTTARCRTAPAPSRARPAARSACR
jgi:hypothetical protein